MLVGVVQSSMSELKESMLQSQKEMAVANKRVPDEYVV